MLEVSAVIPVSKPPEHKNWFKIICLYFYIVVTAVVFIVFVVVVIYTYTKVSEKSTGPNVLKFSQNLFFRPDDSFWAFGTRKAVLYLFYIDCRFGLKSLICKRLYCLFLKNQSLVPIRALSQNKGSR